MKNRLVTIVACFCALSSCAERSLKNNPQSRTYIGDFAGDPLELSLLDLDDSLVKGISKHKGVVSEMSGKKLPSDKGYTYVMKELGNNPYQGIFQFELDTSLHLIFGSWQILDTGKRLAILYTLTPSTQK